MAIYVDQSDIEDNLGSGFLEAVAELPGIDLDRIIRLASGLVRQRIRQARKYDPPDSTDPDLMLDENVKAAVIWAIRVQVSNVPEESIPLPDKPELDPMYVAWQLVGKPEAVLDLPTFSQADDFLLIGDRVI